MPGAHQNCSTTPPPQLGRGEGKYDGRLEARTGRDHSPTTVMDETDNLGRKGKFTSSPIKSE